MDRKGFVQSWQKKEVTFQEDSARDFVLQEHCFIIQKLLEQSGVYKEMYRTQKNLENYGLEQEVPA